MMVVSVALSGLILRSLLNGGKVLLCAREITGLKIRRQLLGRFEPRNLRDEFPRVELLAGAGE
jgi:hypothetical protein